MAGSDLVTGRNQILYRKEGIVTKPQFAHLHCHSHYSLLDGTGMMSQLLQRTKDLGMDSLALTDQGNLYGSLAFYNAAMEMGVRPVLGMEAYVASGSRFLKDSTIGPQEASYEITLLAENRIGFQNMMKLSSLAYLEGSHGCPRLDKELLAAYSEGIICLSGGLSSELNQNLLSDDSPTFVKSRETAGWYHKVFGDRYFIEVQNNGLDRQRSAMEKALDVARGMGLPVVATNDIHYVCREDAEAHGILRCIGTGKVRDANTKTWMGTNEFYLRSPEEMAAAFPGQEEALRLTQEIASRCQVELDLGKKHFPVLTPPGKQAPEEFLRTLVIEGLKERYVGSPERLVDGQLSDEVMDRVEQELAVISKLGLANYFLVVWGIVHFARTNGIPATARGSCAGSIVAYGLYLSHVCPLEYDLLFERFLDEGSQNVPDIDIDFCQLRRGEVIRHVKDKYGPGNVAEISTFGTMAARSSIRDVGRTLGMPISRADSIVAMLSDELKVTVKSVLRKGGDLKNLYDTDPEIHELLTLADKLEGLARNVGTHAAAVVIADRPIMDYVPLRRGTGDGKEIVTQWNWSDVEKAGLLKMDFLGLRNLTILGKVIDWIEQTTGEKLAPNKFPLDDKETFAMIGRGETEGVFQLESTGIRELLQRIKPETFREIIAVNALYRPGPLRAGMVENYIQGKHSSTKVAHEHPVLEDVLAETYGVVLYQEQVMQILHRLGGVALADAFSCIKAIAKNKQELVARHREQFIEGACHKCMTKGKAQEVFERIARYAGYTFNKAHSTAYAMIAYQTAYLKAHYPFEFTSIVEEDLCSSS